ncbi:16189_t:CDS:1, partial [Gigaspora rosea]
QGSIPKIYTIMKTPTDILNIVVWTANFRLSSGIYNIESEPKNLYNFRVSTNSNPYEQLTLLQRLPAIRIFRCGTLAIVPATNLLWIHTLWPVYILINSSQYIE